MEAILALKETAKEYDARSHELENELGALALQPDMGSRVAEVDDELRQCRARHAQVTASINKAIAALGIPDRRNFEQVAASEYLRLRVNARSLKFRIRQRVQEHKFERERIDQLYRNVMNSVWQSVLYCTCADRPHRQKSQ